MTGRKFNSLKRGEAVDEVVVQLAVAEYVVGLVGVDDEQSGSPEAIQTWSCLRALRLEYTITKRLLKGRTFWLRLIKRKHNSLKRGDAIDEVVHAVVAEEVAHPVEVDNEQSGFPETMRTLWSWLIGRKFNSLKRGKAVDEVAV